MPRQITAIKCTTVLAQVNLGFFDEAGNLVGEETFPQVGEKVGTAKLFHPHREQLMGLIESCVAQAWEKLSRCGQEDSAGEAPAPIFRSPVENATDGTG